MPLTVKSALNLLCLFRQAENACKRKRLYRKLMPPLPGTETIMIVDDEAPVVSLTAMMLERHGYQVIAAHNGKEALHLFEVWPDLEVDLLMVDIVMPEMNGVEFAERMAKLRPDVPVLFFSAYSDQEILRPVIARGIPYIPKPFTSTGLTTKIRHLLDTPKKADAENA